MIFKQKYIFSLLFISNLLFSAMNQIQLVTTHKKSNGTLLRVVTNRTMNIEDIAGWAGQENWFYLTFNKTTLNPSSMDYIVFEPPLMDLESTKNNESVQLGYLFERPIQDFEIFHSEASRVVLIQVWDSLSDSIITELESSEQNNANLVFSLPSKEAKGSPFYDSFIYARDKYGPEKYFVWYNNWYSTEDVSDTSFKSETPTPLIVKKDILPKQQKKVFPDLKKIDNILKKPSINTQVNRQKPSSLNQTSNIDISLILKDGMLVPGSERLLEVKALQEALISLGYYLGSNGSLNNGVDGEY